MFFFLHIYKHANSGLMVNAVDFVSSGPGVEPGRSDGIAFLSKTQVGTGEL